MPVKPGGADDYNDAIQEFAELVESLQLDGRASFKLAMAFGKGLIAAHERGRREALDEQAARNSSPYPTGWAGCNIPGHQGCDPWNCRWAPVEEPVEGAAPDCPPHPYDGCGACITWREWEINQRARGGDRRG